MKLNNKAFAASTILYGMLTISIILLTLILGIMRSNHTLNSKLVSNTESYINSCIAEEIDLNKCKLEKTNCTDDQIAYCNCLSDLKTSPQNCSPYEYIIGDQIEYQGSNWRVIKNSLPNEDYVTLLKEETSINMIYSTSSNNYSSNYNVSEIKKYLEEYNEARESDLKEVNGYKIRLININELMNAGCTKKICSNSPYSSWLIGEHSYWTMTPEENSNDRVLEVSSSGIYSQSLPNNNSEYVRPVINLLKSAIE